MKNFSSIIVCFWLLSIMWIGSFTPEAQALQKLSKRQCAAANWSVIGARDALRGRPSDYASIHEDKCGKTKNPLNFNQWTKGYQAMISTVCTPEYSYGLGLSGRKLLLDCSDYEDDLQRANEIALQYQKYRKNYESAVNSYNQSVNNIKSAQQSIRRAQGKLSGGDLDAKGIDKQRNRISRARSTIDRENQSLNGREYEIDQAKNALDRYSAQSDNFERTLGELAPIEFDTPITIKANIKKASGYSVRVNLNEIADPIYFNETAMIVDNLNTPTREDDGVRKCKVDRKISRALKKEWKKLEKQVVTLNIYSLNIVPPGYKYNYSTTISGDIITQSNGDLITYLQNKGLSVGNNEAPLPNWFRNKDYFADWTPKSNAQNSDIETPSPAEQ